MGEDSSTGNAFPPLQSAPFQSQTPQPSQNQDSTQRFLWPQTPSSAPSWPASTGRRELLGRQNANPGNPFSQHVKRPQQSESEVPEGQSYSHIDRVTRIAVYDDALSSPRIVDIEPDETKSYIANAASTTYDLAKQAGGSIPYTVILELVENFIHANFKESVISVFDGGNTIRFSDQGPGIEKKSLAQQPGYSSATAGMKEYIRGVGSGFPIVKSYLSVQQGRLLIDDNINGGAVITISVGPFSKTTTPATQASDNNGGETEKPAREQLTEREYSILALCDENGGARLTDVCNAFGYPTSSVHNLLAKLSDTGLLELDPNAKGKTYVLTEAGEAALNTQ